MTHALLIEVAFPRGVYSGATFGEPEDVPSFARLHEAFVAAAGGGPYAIADARILTGLQEHRAAVQWLEDHEPLGMRVPAVRLCTYTARRHRFRASPRVRSETPFEPFSALAGRITYAWPTATTAVTEELARLACEITHVGRSDSAAIVSVRNGEFDVDLPGTVVASEGRGPGRVSLIARPGRQTALIEAHCSATSPGGHRSGSMGRQAPDVLISGASTDATALRRFAPSGFGSPWPYTEILRLPVVTRMSRAALRSDRRVGLAVAVHRALIRELRTDVPAYITGRDSGGPLRGHGHLAIHVLVSPTEGVGVALAIPRGVTDADRATLLSALARGLRVTYGRQDLRLDPPEVGPALPFWAGAERLMRTAVPLVLDTTGTPRRGSWSLDDAVTCSIAYAMRGALEDDGVRWASGWDFRRELVARLTGDYRVVVRAQRLAGPASRYVHRSRPGELLIATHATIDLGRLAKMPGGFLAVGRARHLGGGLLVPLEGFA